MMLLHDVEDILARCTFPDRRFRVLSKGDGFLVQVEYEEADIETGRVETQRGRKWYVSQHAIEPEIVRTAFLACLQSMEHAAREHFLYLGRRIFSPHYDLAALVEACDRRRFEQRPSGK